MKATKAQRLAAARELHPSYNITAVKTMSREELESREAWGSDSLEDLYDNPSQAKRESYEAIIRQYNPDILAVAGSSMAYSVLLKTEDGVYMHITRDNNYLVEVEA